MVHDILIDSLARNTDWVAIITFIPYCSLNATPVWSDGFSLFLLEMFSRYSLRFLEILGAYIGFLDFSQVSCQYRNRTLKHIKQSQGSQNLQITDS